MAIRSCFATIVLIVGLMATPAWAIPSYSAQTNQPCSSCHVGGFGPQLTPTGRSFKLNGYTSRADDNVFPMPISGEATFSFVNTAKAQATPPADHYATNNNFSLDTAGLVIAGGFGDHFGAFAQVNYDGIGRTFAWEMVDLRATDELTLWGNDVVLGLDLNNSPGSSDSWNTLPANAFPYSGSDLAPSPAAGTIFSGGLEMTVLGTSAYAYWNSSIYTEVGLYWTPGHGFLRAMGASSDMGPGGISGVAPYFRLAYTKDYNDQNFEVGAFGFFPKITPTGAMGSSTPVSGTDAYSDFGIDGSYQFMGDGDNIYTVNARYTHEWQSLNASVLMGNAANVNNSLDDFRVDASYYWHNLVGGTVQLFETTGSKDEMLYADSRTFSPDSEGVVFQIDGTPWGTGNSPFDNRLNLRVGIQYTMYTKFGGASSNYDGAGRSASDNNTLRIFTWLSI